MAESRVAFDLQIPSDVEYIEGVVELARQRCRELKLSSTKCSLNVPVALTEALSNAILRGNEATGGKQVRVRALISDTDLVFEVVDEGPGFDLDECTVDCTTGAACPTPLTCQNADTGKACFNPPASADYCKFCSDGSQCSTGQCVGDGTHNWCTNSCSVN